MADFTQMKLGKKPARVDTRTLKIAQYLPVLPPAPEEVDWTSGLIDWGMMANDLVGDCTIASKGHNIQTWMGAIGSPVTITDSVILNYYAQWDGYVPGDSSTDNGGVMLDVLNRWRKEGFAGYTIKGYVGLDVWNLEHIKQAIYLFGLADIGIELPFSAQSQDVWHVVSGPDSEPGSWGGHDTTINKYNPIGPVCVTWGGLQQMTWEFFQRYTSEAYAILLDEWLKWAPNDYHFLGNLDNDLIALAG